MNTITPPFKDLGEGGAEFLCLAFAPVTYRPTKAPHFPAALGIYFCAHKDFAPLSRISFTADGRTLSYTRGDDRRPTMEWLLLNALLDQAVHPGIWRLFPRTQIPSDFQSDPYEAARRDLCLLLFAFRSKEMVARAAAGFPNNPLMVCDESAKRIALSDFPDEDKEMEQALKAAKWF